jgi:glycosyltransferase involved in cell wall biosynthesis
LPLADRSDGKLPCDGNRRRREDRRNDRYALSKRGKMAARLYRQRQGGAHAREVLIADNGSADGSQLIARALGATLVEVSQPGYGAALTSGMQSASGTLLVMGDADGSYDFRECVEMIRALLSGSLHGVALQRRDQNQRDALEEPICRQSSAYRSLEPSIRRRRK